MRSFLLRTMSPISRQPNLSKSFTELSFTVFSIYSKKARTSTGSSIPCEAAVTCARVRSICIVTCRTAVTLVTWRAFVDIWSKENYSLGMCQGIQSIVVKYFESYFKTDLPCLLSLVFVSLSLVFVHVLFSCFDRLFLLVFEVMLSSRIYLLPY